MNRCWLNTFSKSCNVNSPYQRSTSVTLLCSIRESYKNPNSAAQILNSCHYCPLETFLLPVLLSQQSHVSDVLQEFQEFKEKCTWPGALLNAPSGDGQNSQHTNGAAARGDNTNVRCDGAALPATMVSQSCRTTHEEQRWPWANTSLKQPNR